MSKYWIFMIVAALFISGCNTVQGVGEDIEQGGEAVQRSAN